MSESGLKYEILVPTKYLKVLKLFAACKDVRKCLNGLCFEFGGGKTTTIAATDGYLLGIFRVEGEVQGECQQFIVPTEAMEKSANSSAHALFTFSSNAGGKEVKVFGECSATITMAAIEGKYPNIGLLVTDSVSGIPSAFNPAHLATLSKAAKILHRNPLRFSVADNGHSRCPIDLQHEDFTGVVMPLGPSDCFQKPKATAAWFNDLTKS